MSFENCEQQIEPPHHEHVQQEIAWLDSFQNMTKRIDDQITI